MANGNAWHIRGVSHTQAKLKKEEFCETLDLSTDFKTKIERGLETRAQSGGQQKSGAEVISGTVSGSCA